jgi:peptidoglycan/xylan/chitin deacetylase (PgdA/CDA1 family)
MGVKRSILAALHGLGAFGLARRIHRARFLGATVLLYHRVMPVGTPVDHHARLLGDPTSTELEALIRFLMRNFRFATPADCVERWSRGQELDPYTLLLTFDDGYVDLHDELLPLLTRCQVPATVFVTTGAIAGRPTWFQRLFAAMDRTTRAELPAFDGVPATPLGTPAQRVEAIEMISAAQRRHPARAWEDLVDRLCEELGWDGGLAGQEMMSWDQVAALHRSGLVTVGGHTVTHPCLENCDADQLRHEIFGSAEELRARLPGIGFMPFSYPHGRCPSAAVRDMVREAGYGCAFTGRWATNTRATPLYELGRQHLPPGDVARSSLMLSGLTGGHAAAARRRRRAQAPRPADDGARAPADAVAG